MVEFDAQQLEFPSFSFFISYESPTGQCNRRLGHARTNAQMRSESCYASVMMKREKGKENRWVSNPSPPKMHWTGRRSTDLSITPWLLRFKGHSTYTLQTVFILLIFRGTLGWGTKKWFQALCFWMVWIHNHPNTEHLQSKQLTFKTLILYSF